MGSKGEDIAVRNPVQNHNGYRSPDPETAGIKYATPIPPIDSPGGGSVRYYDSQRQSRNSMQTPGDKLNNDQQSIKRFTGKSTLKNPFG